MLLDVFTEDPRWGDWSQTQLTDAAQRGAIVVNAVVLAEIAPRFSRIEALHSALPSMTVIEEIPAAAAFLAGHAHTGYRRAGGPREAILPDFLIGAHAAVTGRPLLTRDPRRVASHIPGATLIVPEEETPMMDHPGLVFRGGPDGRRAALVEGPDVWQVVSVLQAGESRGEQAVRETAEWMSLAVEQVRAAAGYYAEHPEEIDERIRRNAEEAERAEQAWRSRRADPAP